MQCAIVANLEDLRGRLHAEPVEVAEVQIDNDLHDVQPFWDALLPQEPRGVGLP